MVTCARASPAYEDDASGNWISFANNVPRITNKGLLVEEARTNSIRNNSMQGAVPGSPGTPPTNWGLGGLGVTQTIVGVGTINGIDYIDIRMNGTTTSTALAWVLDGTTTLAAASGQVWTSSWFVALVGGSTANLTGLKMRTSERSGTGTVLLNNIGPDALALLTPSLVRQSYTVTLSNASTAFIQPQIEIDAVNAAAIDFTLRIGWPQWEQGPFATSPIRTTSAAVTRAADQVTLASPPTFGSAYSLFAAATPNAPINSSSIQTLIAVNDGTINNRFQLDRNSNDAHVRMFYDVSSAVSVQYSAFTWNQLTSVKIAAAAQDSDQAFCVNGGLPVGTLAAAGVPVVNNVSVGYTSSATLQFNGYITRAAIWATQRLPNANLVAGTK
jgi:hypothetical protein